MEGEKDKALTNYQLIIIDTESCVTSPGVENLREKIKSRVRVLENSYCVFTYLALHIRDPYYCEKCCICTNKK